MSAIICPIQRVEPEWIDYNGHLNMAYYHVLFDRAVDVVYNSIGIGEAYVQTDGNSCFSREVHVNYVQELSAGDPVLVSFQLLDWDAKRLHFFERMVHAERGFLAATSEQLALHVDMQARRTAPFPEVAQARLSALMDQHEKLPKPGEVGQVMQIRR